jgi:hypothetical protein
MGLSLVALGCGGDDGANQGTGSTTPTVAPPAPVTGNPAGSAATPPPANPGSTGTTPPGTAGTGQPQMTPVGTVPMAGSMAPMTMAGGPAIPMAGTTAIPMGGRGGRGGMGGMSGAAGMAGRAGSAGMAGSGTAGSMMPPDGCMQNLTCQLAALPSTGDFHQDCVDRVNQFRTQCACLPALARWTEGEACADMMAQYDAEHMSEGAHAGFKGNICSGGSSQNECPGWRSETMVVSGCLQSMWNEGPPPSQPCDGACFQMYGHFINMTSTRSTKVACGIFTTSSGQIWSVQNFSR